MPLSDPATALYKPTRREAAYGIYIFDQLFSFPVNGNFHLDATQALPVLVQKSGVNGLFLRSMWSVVDPDNNKCLTEVSQFHVLMRLIALSQDGLLEQEINNAFNQERGQTTPAAVMQKSLWMSADYDDCPLPSFEGVPIPSDDFLLKFSEKLKGIIASSPAPAPAPIPVKRTSAPVPAPIPISKPAAPPPKSTPPPKVPGKNDADRNEKDFQSAIHQLEGLSFNNKQSLDSLKELDPDNFELLQEQAALQRALLESSNSPPGKTKKKDVSSSTKTKKGHMSEEEAIQRAIYESTHNAASPSKPASTPNVASVAAAMPKERENWLRMSSFNDSSSEVDDSDDGGYKKKKAKKGNAAYAEYLASQDPSTAALLQSETKKDSGKDTKSNEVVIENDMKPAAKPSAKAAPVQQSHRTVANSEATLEPKGGQVPAKNSTPTTIRPDDKNCVDEYPQAVQELVMNGFELEKAIQGYKMLGDNFDDIVLFLTSNMTIKELVINGFNIRKVVQAYDLIGDNMDDLIAYLMDNPP